MSSKKQLKNDIKRLKIKLQLQTSDALITNNISIYQAHFEALRADKLAKENEDLRKQLSALTTPPPAANPAEVPTAPAPTSLYVSILEAEESQKEHRWPSIKL